MRTPRVRKNATDEEMGLGWHLRRVGGVMTAAHGGTLGHCLLVELVPERHLALAILTNHSERLAADSGRRARGAANPRGLPLEPAQSIGHRGVNETMPDAPILATQPDPAPYVGVYRRPPSGSNTVRVQNGQLMVDGNPIAFFGPDRAVVTAAIGRGNPVEFIRNATGDVGWVRVVGRIAKKDEPPTARATIGANVHHVPTSSRSLSALAMSGRIRRHALRAAGAAASAATAGGWCARGGSRRSGRALRLGGERSHVEEKVTARFDADRSGWLNAVERKAARETLAREAAARGPSGLPRPARAVSRRSRVLACRRPTSAHFPRPRRSIRMSCARSSSSSKTPIGKKH